MTISTMTTFRIKRKLRLKYEPLKYHKQLLWIGGSLRMLGYDPIVCYWGWNIVCLRTWLHPFGAIKHHLVLNMIPWRKYCWFWRQELDITSHHYAIQDMDDSAPILFYPSEAWFRIKYYFLVFEDANLLSQEISMILAQSSFSLRIGILFLLRVSSLKWERYVKVEMVSPLQEYWSYSQHLFCNTLLQL